MSFLLQFCMNGVPISGPLVQLQGDSRSSLIHEVYKNQVKGHMRLDTQLMKYKLESGQHTYKLI